MEAFSLLMRACGIAVLASVCILTVSRLSGSFAALLRICGALLIFAVFLGMLGNTVSALREAVLALSGNSFAGEAFELMLKALGIALVGRFCSDVCRDCGESTLANGIESVGRIAIFTISLPMMIEVLSLAGEILGMAG